MSLKKAAIGIRILETNENYIRADKPLRDNIREKCNIFNSEESIFLSGDKSFWTEVIKNPDYFWGKKINFECASLSEWVARVPGLYWMPGAAELRRIAEQKVAYISNGWTVYKPIGKSKKVEGGIGTLRLPPSYDGLRLATLTMFNNASMGIPALISPDVWAKIGMNGPHEGCVLSGAAVWQAMEEGWAKRFKSTRNIPRGYLIINNPDEVWILKYHAPTIIHPFTIMEYREGSKELFDYVYASSDTVDPKYRQDIMNFFDSYKIENNREGRYLLSCDMIDPLWDADYQSPDDLRRSDSPAGSQLAILEARVREQMLGKNIIEKVLEALGSVCTSNEDVKRISKEIGIQPSFWFQGGTLAKVCNQFLEEVYKKKKVDELIENIAISYPSAIK